MSAAQVFAMNVSSWSDVQDHMHFLFDQAHGNVMEIGVRGGNSTSALLAGIEAHGGHLWSFDIGNCPVFNGNPDWTFTQADSINDADRIKSIIPEHLDVLFVDGDHTFEGCYSDLLNYGSRADLILIHDCLCPDSYPGVRKACEQYAAEIGVPLTIREGSYGLGVIETPWKAKRAQRIPGWMTVAELMWLAKQAATHAVCVEVGSYLGQSTRAMGDAARGVVYAVDDWKGLREEWWANTTPRDVQETLFERFSENLKDLLAVMTVVWIKADHRSMDMDSMPDADFIFIDGSHKYEDVKQDIGNWLPKLRPGGLMAGHDSNQDAVMLAVREFFPNVAAPVGLIWAQQI